MKLPATPDYLTAVHTMACPHCLRQPFHVIDPQCLPCGGTGVLALGPAALRDFPPETVALAITMALDDAATLDDDSQLAVILTLDTAGVLNLDHNT